MSYVVTVDLVVFTLFAWALVPSYSAEGAAMATFLMEGLNVVVQCGLVYTYTRTPQPTP